MEGACASKSIGGQQAHRFVLLAEQPFPFVIVVFPKNISLASVVTAQPAYFARDVFLLAVDRLEQLQCARMQCNPR